MYNENNIPEDESRVITFGTSVTAGQNNRVRTRLRQDGLNKRSFLRLLIDAYERSDKRLRDIIAEHKENTGRGNCRTRKFEQKSYDRREETIRDLNLNGSLSRSEIEDLFDILEEEIGD